MIEFDADATARFFNQIYRDVDQERGKRAETRLHPRDLIFLKYIASAYAAADCRILDYGCGQGRLLSHLLKLGFDAEGMEKHDEMRAVALAETSSWSKGQPRVRPGGIEGLEALPSEQLDIFVAMGVFQYMPKTEYFRTLAQIRRLLKPGGVMIATYQNAFFDLYTFNKYTVDFIIDRLALPHVDAAHAVRIKKGIEGLIANPDKPLYATTRARDNIFVHLTNPLTINDHLQTAGFAVSQKYFYEFFGLPPLIAGQNEAIAKSIAAKFEIDNATSWQGYFMANAFLTHARKL